MWWFDVVYFIFFFFLHLLLFTCIKEIKEQRDRERETNKQRENDGTIQSYSLLTFCCCLNKSKPWPVKKKTCFDSFSFGFNRPPCDKLKSLQSSV